MKKCNQLCEMYLQAIYEMCIGEIHSHHQLRQALQRTVDWVGFEPTTFISLRFRLLAFALTTEQPVNATKLILHSSNWEISIWLSLY